MWFVERKPQTTYNKQIKMSKTNFEKLEIYQLSEELSDKIWNIVVEWKKFSKDTVGEQLVKATDSIGANIAEGSGKGSYKDNRRFVRIARGSLFETRHWLRRAVRRKLLSNNEVDEIKILIDELTPKLSGYIKYLGKKEKSTNDKRQTTN